MVYREVQPLLLEGGGGMNLYWSLSQPILVVITTNIGHDANLYRSARRPI